MSNGEGRIDGADPGAGPASDGTDGPVDRGFVVTGRVQGVGFRWWTRQCARELGLAGTVRNRPDGAVEICAHGAADSLSMFESRLWAGPATARVDGVVHRPCDLTDGTTDFTIER